MKQPQNNSMITGLRWKSVAVIMGIVLIFVVGILSTLYLSSRAGFEQRSRESLRAALRRIEDRGNINPRVGRSPVSNSLAALTVDKDGSCSLIENRTNNCDDETLIMLASKLYEARDFSGIAKDLSLRYASEALKDGGVVYVMMDVSFEQAALRSQLLHSLGIGMTTLLIFFGVSLLLSQWMIRPVASAWEEQRRFVADASHELKTPLTVVLANTDMLMESHAITEERNLKRLDHIKAESLRMKGLVENLLTLARSDNRKGKSQHERLCLSQLMTYSLLSMEPAIFESGRSLEDHIEENMFVHGESGKLQQLVEILLDNACKYSPDGSVIKVTLENGPKRECILSVRSEGTPLPLQNQKTHYCRFYRADPSPGSAAGYGLGLSIAQAIVQEHKGRVFVRCEDDHSNTFTVLLPKA